MSEAADVSDGASGAASDGASDAERDAASDGERGAYGETLGEGPGALPGGAGAGRDAVGPVLDYVRGLKEFARRRIAGEYEVDAYGYDADFTESVALPPLRWMLKNWFRTELLGMENLPADRGALLVANHSGTIAIDAVMLAAALNDVSAGERPLRMLGADLVFDTPFLGSIARKTGSTVACRADAERLLTDGNLVAVFPEGFKGVGKPFSQRYQLQRFGRGGFVASALRTGAPIVPVSIVGAEEAYPMLADVRPLARLLGLPYFPVTPTFPLLGPLGAVPLPSKWLIEFGEPVETAEHESGAADDPMTVFNLADQVREQIQQSLYRLLLRRGQPF